MNSKYTCDKCNYLTNVKQNYDKHLLSKKHNIKASINEEQTDHPIQYLCVNCNKRYKYRSGLWNHKKKCSCISLIVNPVNDKKINAVKELRDEIKKQNENIESLKNIIIDLVKNQPIPLNITNNNNNNFNINIFLKKCNNAINFTDFINSIKIELNDIQYIGDIGYIKGISKIINERLKIHSIYERPIHCINDNVNKVIHIKDEDTWKNEKDDVKSVIDKNIYTLDKKINNKILVFQNKTGNQFIKECNELKMHGGLHKENTEEQNEITNEIIEQVKIPNIY
jgi:hypothetical protein